MKIHSKKIIMLFIFSFLLSACTKEKTPSEDTTFLPITNTPTPTWHEDWSIPSETPSITVAPTPDSSDITQEATNPDNNPEVPTSAPTPSITPTPEIVTPLPVSDFHANMMLNYNCGFPIVRTEEGEVEFSYYDDTVIIRNSDHTDSFSLSERIEIEGYELTDPELWYFVGAFPVNNVIYAHFDYLDARSQTPSLLISVDPSTGETVCELALNNPKKHFSDNFTFNKNIIYYTTTAYSNYGTVTSSLCFFDTVSKTKGTLYITSAGEYIKFMTSAEDKIYFVLSNSAETNSLYSLQEVSLKKELLRNELTEPEFLSVWKNAILLSCANNQLTYFDLNTSSIRRLTITSETKYIGQPITNGFQLFISLYDPSVSNTQLFPIMTDTATIGENVLPDSYTGYIAGMFENEIYFETEDGFVSKSFPYYD